MERPLSHSIRKRFAKDFELPITLVQDPWWDYLIDLYDPLFSIKNNLEKLYLALEACGGEAQFFEESDKVSKTLIQDIKETEAYKEFINKPLKIDLNALLEADQWLQANGNKDLYIAEHAGRCFVSFDLKQANFNVLNWYDPNIVLGQRTWLDLVGKYASGALVDYLSKSKYFRQIVFGHLNPRRQRSLIRYINLTQILPLISDQKIVSVSDDQCVFESEGDLVGEQNKWREIETFLPVTVSAFQLIRLGDKPYYVREGVEKIEFKCVPAHYFSECFKYYYGMELGELDGFTYHEGRIVKYVKPLFT